MEDGLERANEWETGPWDAEWSWLKMVLVWTSVILVEMGRSGRCRICYGDRATGLLISKDVAKGRKVNGPALTLTRGQLANTQALEASPSGMGRCCSSG